VQGVLDSWAGDSAREIPQYAAGSAGPAAADALLARDRCAWLPIGADGARRKHGA
jgi:glucose-6-phosphate 1-dehydrogenase